MVILVALLWISTGLISHVYLITFIRDIELKPSDIGWLIFSAIIGPIEIAISWECKPKRQGKRRILFRKKLPSGSSICRH